MLRWGLWKWAFVIALAGACSPFQDASPGVMADAGEAGGPALRCDLAKPFGARVPFASPVASGASDFAAALSADGSRLYIASTRDGGTQALYFAKGDGSGLNGAWTDVQPLMVLDNGGSATNPSISRDQQMIVFDSTRTGSMKQANIWSASRTGPSTGFDIPTPVEGANTDSNDREPWITPTGERLYFSSDRSGSPGLYVGTRARAGTISAVTMIAELSTPTNAEAPVLTADERTIFFSSSRQGGASGQDIWTAHRASVPGAFDAPMLVAVLNTADDDYPTWISEDGCEIIVETFAAASGAKIFHASRLP
jgi:Tol biopolymer transport system component